MSESVRIPLEQIRTVGGGPLEALARRLVLGRLRALSRGSVRLVENNQMTVIIMIIKELNRPVFLLVNYLDKIGENY